jgi:hypothetical protein
MHAEVELLDGDPLRVRDLDSENGTLLIRQGREFPIKQEVVFLNDTLRFGEVALAARDVIDILKTAAQQDVARPDVAARAAPAAAAIRTGSAGTVTFRTWRSAPGRARAAKRGAAAKLQRAILESSGSPHGDVSIARHGGRFHHSAEHHFPQGQLRRRNTDGP